MRYVDFYKVLGVQRSASQEEVTKAYKGLARKYHPDLNKEQGAEERFKEVNEAYEVLKDPETRQRYDQLGMNYKHGARMDPPPGFGGAAGSEDFFEAFFGGLGRQARSTRGAAGIDLDQLFGGGWTRTQNQGPRRGANVESTLTLDLEDLHQCGTKKVTLSGPQGRKTYDVKLPRGVRPGDKIRLSGQGQLGPGGAGDLFLQLQLRPHARLQREGDDLILVREVPAWDAALGCRLTIQTLDNEVTLTLPPGQSSGQRLRLRSKGLPKADDQHGDLFVELKITVPETLSAAQEKLFKKLSKLAEES